MSDNDGYIREAIGELRAASLAIQRELERAGEQRARLFERTETAAVEAGRTADRVIRIEEKLDEHKVDVTDRLDRHEIVIKDWGNLKSKLFGVGAILAALGAIVWAFTAGVLVPLGRDLIAFLTGR